MTTLHLMLAFVLFGLGAGCLVLYWFTAVSPKFTAAYTPFAVFGTCSLLAGIAIAAVAVFNKKWLMNGRRSAALRVIEVGLIGSAALVFLLAGQKIPAAIFGIVASLITIAAFWEAQKPAARTIVINESGISMQHGGGKLYRWSEIESVILRHSILSVELIGNRLMQRAVVDSDIDGGALETYCAGLIRQFERERAANAAW
jgi:hypothetical protein